MFRRKRSFFVRTLIFLFFFIFLSFGFFFFLHSSHAPPSLEPLTQAATTTSLKPWPFLPSFLPWNSNSKPQPGSCEAYFGNGFSRRIDAHGKGPGGAGGWFRCFYSATLRSSICEGGRLRMDASKIKMSFGGETLDSVMGRREEEELPKFDSGSFQIDGDGSEEGSDGRMVDEEFLDSYMPNGAIHFHTMRGLMESMRIVGPGELHCSQWIEEPTILVTRFEYANLFHTFTDWYSAYVSSRVTGLPNRPHLIFVDGHCKAPLEETWRALFSSIRYAKDFTSPVCFRHVILSPLGYDTAIFKGLSKPFVCRGTPADHLRANPENQKTARLLEFGEMLRAAFGLPVGEPSPTEPSTAHNILFVRRENYVAHPRQTGKLKPRLTNEPEVFAAVQSWAANHTKCSLNVVSGFFAHMTMKEQVRAVYEASVVVGTHGAGLTHLVSASSKTIVLEILSSQFQRQPHFPLISQWKGLEYHAINLAGSNVQAEMVIDELSSIVRSLGC